MLSGGAISAAVQCRWPLYSLLPPPAAGVVIDNLPAVVLPSTMQRISLWSTLIQRSGRRAGYH